MARLRRGLLGSAAAVFAARLATAVATLAATPFIFAELGSEGYGLWAVLMGAYAVAGLGDLGLGSAQLREVARAHASDRPGEAAPALALGALVLPLVGLAFGGVVHFSWPIVSQLLALGNLDNAGLTSAMLLAAALATDGFASPWRAVLEGTGHIRLAAVVTGGSGVLASALGVVLVTAGHGVAGLALGWVIAAALRALILLALGRLGEPEFRPRLRGLDVAEVRRVLGYGAQVQAAHGAAAVNNEADRLLIGGAFSTAAAAAFDVGSRLASALRLVPWCALYAFFPAVAALDARRDRAALDRLYLRATRALAAFSCIGGAALVVSAEPLVRLWIGTPLPLAATSLALLAAGYAVNLISGAGAAITRAEGEPGRETRAMLVTAALNVGLSIPLLLAVGVVGVPAGTALATVAGTIYFVWLFHRESGRPLRPLVDAIWPPFAAAVVAGVATAALAGLSSPGEGRLDAAAAVLGRAALCLAIGLSVLAGLRQVAVRRGRVVAELATAGAGGGTR